MLTKFLMIGLMYVFLIWGLLRYLRAATQFGYRTKIKIKESDAWMSVAEYALGFLALTIYLLNL